MADQPIACTLTSDQKRDRMSLIGTLASDALVGHEPIDGGVRARFRNDPGIERRVRDLAAAEAQCCAFLRFDVDNDASAVLLDITGSPQAQPAIRAMFPLLVTDAPGV
ncbi:MAG: hypothetical protein M3N47_13340 [Chloroflexota bacterium]|nr:hypothetical protein [Chloroflexota bacterium]